MTPAQTKLLIVGGAILTAGLIWFAPKEADVAVSEPSKAGKALKVRTVQPPPLSVAAQSLDKTLKPVIDRDHLAQKAADNLFAKSSWVVVPPPPPPPPPAPPPPPPPPPSAPPLPYVVMGRFEQGDSNLVILMRGTRVVSAAQGDVLENTYRVDRIEASKVTFTYLPLGTSQSLPTGSAQ